MIGLLNIKDLQVRFAKDNGRVVYALNGVRLRVRAGEVVGILGESGSGKSTLAKTLLRLLPRTAQVTGEIEFGGRNILELSERELNHVRGSRIALIPQEPGLALNPVRRIGDQVAEVLRVHRGWNWKRCREEAEFALSQVGLRSAGRRLHDSYPHQLSGGQQQRAVIAQCLACQPELIIADEPTASLDSEIEGQILGLFRDLKIRRNAALLFVTHNPELLRNCADRVAVLYAGRIVETISASAMFEDALHPYTRGLLACTPTEQTRLAAGLRLETIAGMPPDPESPASGCSFAPRCNECMDLCKTQNPERLDINEEESVECFLHGH